MIFLLKVRECFFDFSFKWVLFFVYLGLLLCEEMYVIVYVGVVIYYLFFVVGGDEKEYFVDVLG